MQRTGRPARQAVVRPCTALLLLLGVVAAASLLAHASSSASGASRPWQALSQARRYRRAHRHQLAYTAGDTGAAAAASAAESASVSFAEAESFQGGSAGSAKLLAAGGAGGGMARMAMAKAAMPAVGGGGTADAALPADQQAALGSAQQQPLIVKTGHLTVVSRNTTHDFAVIGDQVAALGGYVVRSERIVDQFDAADVDTDGGAGPSPPPQPRISADLRVPAGKFEQAISGARSVAAAVLQETTTGQDVSEEYLDASARASNAAGLRDKLQQLLASAQAVHDVLEVQRELARVTADMEAHAARAQYLAGAAAMSSLHIELQPLGQRSDPEPPSRLRRALAAALDQLQELCLLLLDGSIWLVVVALPVALVLAAAAGAFHLACGARIAAAGRVMQGGVKLGQ